MPIKKGGKKNKRHKKQGAVIDEPSRFIPKADAATGQMYALTTKMLGNRRLNAKCADGKERLVHIPGKFKGRRNWISVGMLLMLNIREFQDDKADVIYIYSPNDAKRLQRKGELEDLISNEEANQSGFVFGGTEDSEQAVQYESGEEIIDLDDL